MISSLNLFTRHANVRFDLTFKVIIWAIRASRWFMVSPGASHRPEVNTIPVNASQESNINRTNGSSINRTCGLTSRIRLGARFLRLGPNPIFFLRTPILLILPISNLNRKVWISSQKKRNWKNWILRLRFRTCLRTLNCKWVGCSRGSQDYRNAPQGCSECTFRRCTFSDE